MGKKKKEELPDYTIADMDLEGMPWNSRRLWQIRPGKSQFGKKDHRREDPTAEAEKAGSNPQDPPLTRKERWDLTWIALKASLLIGGVFAVAGFLFILFCVYVWFR